MKINRNNVKWCARLFSIVLVVAIVDALVVLFVRRPLPFAVAIPCLIPFLVGAFVILPMSSAESVR